MSGKATTNNKTQFKKHYLTTTELARFCGVSRFTIINWIKQGKIKTSQTVGKHYRIAASEAISFLRTLGSERSYKQQKPATSTTLSHCWQNLQKTNCDKKCGKCLIYAKKTNYCFLAIREYNIGTARCRGDCFSCGYFEELFNSNKNKTESKDSSYDKKDKVPVETKKRRLYNLVYGTGRGVHGLKEKVSGLKVKLSRKPLEINSRLEVDDF